MTAGTGCARSRATWFLLEAQEPNKPFPIRLLSRIEVIDKERAEFLLSLA